MSSKKFENLLKGYLDDSLSPEELKLFLQWLHEPGHESQLLASIENTMSGTEILELQNKDEVFKKIMKAAATETRSEIGIQSGKGRIKKLFPYWAAAAILIIIATGGYFLVNRSTVSEESLVTRKDTNHEIAPGGNKAVLTLADGSTIILDSAQNGMLSQQGNSKVIKLDDGKLAYQRGNSAITRVQYNNITTPLGGQYQLELSDGSHVWLNAASSITFPTSFSGKQREVNITGEAYFEVAHNEKMPFHVIVNGMMVEVLGTHFNINAYKDEGDIKTTLLEGYVKVSEGSKSLKIKPGQQALLNSQGLLVLNQNPDVEAVIAWKNGKFDFRNANLSLIMRQLARWYDIEVTYTKDVSDNKYTGIISRKVNISEILEFLESTGSDRFQIQGKKVIVN